MAKTNPVPRMIKYGAKRKTKDSDTYWYQDKNGNWHWHPGKFWSGPKPDTPEKGGEYHPGRQLKAARSEAQGKEKLVKKYTQQRAKILKRKFGEDWRKQLLGGKGKVKQVKRVRGKIQGLREKQQGSQETLAKLREKLEGTLTPEARQRITRQVEALSGSREKRSEKVQRLVGRRQKLTKGLRSGERRAMSEQAARRYRRVKNEPPQKHIALANARENAMRRKIREMPEPGTLPKPGMDERKERMGRRYQAVSNDPRKRRMYAKAMARRRKRPPLPTGN